MVGCGAPAVTEVEKEVTRVVKETVLVEKEVVKEVIKEATSAAPGAAATTAPVAATGKYVEAPMLQTLVAAGSLPPVEERLPPEPLVIEPEDQIGKYVDKWVWAEYPGDRLYQVEMLNSNENFIKWTRDNQGFRNNLLESYEWNDDATELVMHMKQGIKWSDGQPLTFNDYLFWWEDMVMDPDVAYVPPAGYILKGQPVTFEKAGDYTLKATFPTPNPLFLQMLARGTGNLSSCIQITPRHYYEKFHPKYTPGADKQQLLQLFGNWFNDIDRPQITPWVLKEWRRGERAIFTRNPYYWKVDPEGKQLPYFDGFEDRIVQNVAAVQALILNGEVDYQFRQAGAISDYAMLLDGQEKGGYTVDFWGAGVPASIGILFFYNYVDKGIADLLWNQKFRQALSHAVDRQRINDIVFFGEGVVRQFAMPPSAPEFQSPRGQEILKKWETLWIEYDPELAASLLDEIGVVDVNGDGWRERPDGTPLELIVDVDVASAAHTQGMELVKEDWEKVGLKTVMNALELTILEGRAMDGSVGFRVRGGAASGLLVAPGHWAPVENQFYVMFGAKYGEWYESGGKSGEKPPEGSFIERLQELYTLAYTETDEAKRNEKILDCYEVHVTDGPLCLGFVGLTKSPVIRKNYMRNIRTMGETLASCHYSQPNSMDPEQWWKEV
ncbi:MAG: ABC transporter substrate-binding protein [Actinobacteria bacterium]|nr:ABC transporter substrate-binding protein [Actinomycetota bacterium]